MNVLIVEGHSGVAQVLSSYVKLCGHVADEAGNGREALRQLRSSRYDIVITDSEIVSVDGPELCRFVKSHYPDIYVIGMSGYLLALEDLENAGADICFSKPFDIGLVRKAIDGRISPRGPWRA
ncbi:MAG TPA: response regulator [Syntrophales bacterium]|nr:response regulator [Syntrophales bacterium]